MTDSLLEPWFRYGCNVAVLELCVVAQGTQSRKLLDAPKMESENLSEKNLMVATLAEARTERSAGHGHQAWRKVQSKEYLHAASSDQAWSLLHLSGTVRKQLADTKIL